MFVRGGGHERGHNDLIDSVVYRYVAISRIRTIASGREHSRTGECSMANRHAGWADGPQPDVWRIFQEYRWPLAVRQATGGAPMAESTHQRAYGQASPRGTGVGLPADTNHIDEHEAGQEGMRRKLDHSSSHTA